MQFPVSAAQFLVSVIQFSRLLLHFLNILAGWLTLNLLILQFLFFRSLL